jgi:hypothetical protein
MKRSTHVAAPLLASAALSILTGCREQQMKRCVDDHNVVVDDSLCQATQQQNPNNGYYGRPWPYRYYYGGSGGYSPGTVVTGGGYSAAPGVSYSTARGGFGSTHASGGEGGHGGAGE